VARITAKEQPIPATEPSSTRFQDGSHRHRLDLDIRASLISIDFQENVADAQGRAIVMGNDNLNLFHVGHSRGKRCSMGPSMM
jgi:hypothetical protein